MPVAGISTSIGQSFGTTGSDSSSVITAFIVLGQIVVATVVIAVLFHYGKIMVTATCTSRFGRCRILKGALLRRSFMASLELL